MAERNDPENPGKGRALDWFIRSREWSDGEALVCLDADSVANPDYLRKLDAMIQVGARAVQGYNGAADAKGSGLAALSLLTNTMKNAGTYAGRASFVLPAPMMNGWCLTGRVLREIGWKSFSVAEDFEQTLRLGMEGVFSRFAPEAIVFSEKAPTFSAAASQRRRWSGGQSQIAGSLGLSAVRKAVKTRSPGLFELAMDVILPGYATSAGALVIILIFSLFLGFSAAAVLAGLGIVGDDDAAADVL